MVLYLLLFWNFVVLFSLYSKVVQNVINFILDVSISLHIHPFKSNNIRPKHNISYYSNNIYNYNVLMPITATTATPSTYWDADAIGTNITRDSEEYNFIIGTLSFVVLELCGFIFIYSKVVRNFPNVINLILDVSYLFVYSSFQIKKHKTSTVEEFKDTKGVIRIRKSEKDRQHNNQK